MPRSKKSAAPNWTRKHLLGLEDMTAQEILTVLDRADAYLPCVTQARPCPPTLKDRTVLNLFCEDSTRTRTSFTFAAERLGARVFQFHAATSSLNKKESLIDTARNIEAMGLDAIVIRHQERGAPHRLAEAVACSVLNAGDNAHEHPTQALLDMLTIRRRLGRLDGLTLALVGDVRHSRVARSNFFGFSKFASRVICVGPPVFLQALDVKAETATDLGAVLPECDAVMMLRVQFERHESVQFNVDEYIRGYQLTPARLARARPGAIVLHPGPVNRGVELTNEVADGPQSVILFQTTCGVAVRMACLELCIGALDRERRSRTAQARRDRRG
ncbi:MAG: aspartate carbamoyltransferase catalytic subunit [Planctomycetes bacterium]|nr:aspartate carbamoyltransferase catalytic subunit [Planctomycetota bacterium]